MGARTDDNSISESESARRLSAHARRVRRGPPADLHPRDSVRRPPRHPSTPLLTIPPSFHEIVRDAYNDILQGLPGPNTTDPLASDAGTDTDVDLPTPPPARPATPPRKKRTLSRVQSASGRLLSDSTPLSENTFTKLHTAPRAPPGSPSSRKENRSKASKREREEGEGSPPPKKRAS